MVATLELKWCVLLHDHHNWYYNTVLYYSEEGGHPRARKYPVLYSAVVEAISETGSGLLWLLAGTGQWYITVQYQYLTDERSVLFVTRLHTALMLYIVQYSPLVSTVLGHTIYCTITVP